MVQAKKNLTASAKSLFKLGGFNFKTCRHVALQTPDGNTQTVFFGSKALQVGELAPNDSVGMPEENLDELFVKGDPGDEIIINVFR